MFAVTILLYLIFTTITLLYYRPAPSPKGKLRSIVILSGDFEWDTVLRLKRGIELKQLYHGAIIIICGKFRSSQMLTFLKRHGYKNQDVIIQNKSTNTYEDATFLKKIIKKKQLFPMILVTSQPHMRRALHSFTKVFPNREIHCIGTQDLFNPYSAFLPSGWIATIINIVKDYKYNGRYFKK